MRDSPFTVYFDFETTTEDIVNNDKKCKLLATAKYMPSIPHWTLRRLKFLGAFNKILRRLHAWIISQKNTYHFLIKLPWNEWKMQLSVSYTEKKQ